MRALAIFLIAVSVALIRPTQTEACRLALVLALDVSGSVNEAEYSQQLHGVADALGSPPVRSLILASTAVELTVFEWSSQNHQFVVQPWITLDSNEAIDDAVGNIRGYQKKRAGLKTALSTAMLFASELLREKGYCWERKIDVSGDGKNNIGPSLDRVYALPGFSDITVNALVVGDPSSARKVDSSTGVTRDALRQYYEEVVIRGPDAFAMIAFGYEDYARAMQRKLLRELQVPVLGDATRAMNSSDR